MEKVFRLMFVCTGNICRSPLAHRLFERIAKQRGVGQYFECESSGTTPFHVGENADSRMREVVRRRDWELDHISRHLSRQDLIDYDYILAMDRSHVSHIEQMNKLLPQDMMYKVRLFGLCASSKVQDVPDPYYGGSEGFDRVYDLCLDATNGLLDEFDDKLSKLD